MRSNPYDGVDVSPLDTLLRYHIQENHLPSGYAVALGQGALVLIAAAGLLYVKPAADFAEHEDLGIEKSTQIYLNAISTCYSACIVLCAATIFFYRAHVKPQEIPAELEDIIQPPFTATEYSRKNVIIGTAAALSAVPFATIAYMAYQHLPPAEFYPLLVYIFLANTLLHFLPIKLILDDPFYGAVPKYLKKQALRMRGPQVSIEQQLPTNNTQVDLLVSALNSYLAEIMSDLPSSANRLEVIKNYSLTEFLGSAILSATPTSQLTPQEALVARVVGASLVIMSCLGYLANPYLVFNEMLGFSWWAAALITALPTFFLGVLFTYFGDTMGKQIWMDIKADARYISQWLAQNSENPPIFLQSIIFKLYPTAAFVCMALNVGLAVFSAAAAMEMMRFAFEDKVSSEGLLALYVLAQVGVSIVGVYAPLNYQKMLLTYYALYLDQGSRHDIMMFHEGAVALQGDLFRLKPLSSESFVENNEEQPFPYCINPEAVSTNAGVWKWCFWRYSGKSEDRIPLLAVVNAPTV